MSLRHNCVLCVTPTVASTCNLSVLIVAVVAAAAAAVTCITYCVLTNPTHCLSLSLCRGSLPSLRQKEREGPLCVCVCFCGHHQASAHTAGPPSVLCRMRNNSRVHLQRGRARGLHMESFGSGGDFKEETFSAGHTHSRENFHGREGGTFGSLSLPLRKGGCL